jgi:rubrerythrin
MSMADPFNRAENWRERADELRGLAARADDPAASGSLAEMADALDQHARKLEEMALKMGCTRRVRMVDALSREFARAAAD